MSAQTSQNRAADLLTKVAIVEDNATLRQYLAEFVGEAPGLKCIGTCGSAEEAIAKLPSFKPDVVLMDIHLPGESGIACTARLRAIMPQVQVIMLTVYKDSDVIFQALKAGACGYVLKRAEENEILDAIAEVRTGGAPMTGEIARMVVRSFQDELPEAGSGSEQLTPRELQILDLVSDGLSNKEIGNRLGISFVTVRTHLLHIYEKLHVRCRTEAATKYLRNKPAEFGRPSADRKRNVVSINFFQKQDI